MPASSFVARAFQVDAAQNDDDTIGPRCEHSAGTFAPYALHVEAFDALLREALVVCAVICLPVLATAALIGTLVAVVQAATQVQEQTLTLLPKLIAVALIVGVGGHFGLELCATLFRDALDRIPAIVYSLT
jgi:flagellar biosynthetic protein FliQ